MSRPLASVFLALALALAACGGAPGANNPTPRAEQSATGASPAPTGAATTSGAPTGAAATAAPSGGATSTADPAGTPAPTAVSGPPAQVTLGLGYKPDVQFAPFYVAAAKGYYREAGLDVRFRHLGDAELLKLTGTGDLPYAVASGDEMLIARSQGVPLVYVGAYFQKYPVSLIASEASGITSVEQIKGKTIGVPGRFGATYAGLRALLYGAGLSEGDVTIRVVGFTQVDALQRGAVDAVMGYANNEPLQLRRRGVAVRTFPVYESTDLVSNGIITNEAHLAGNREQVAALVRATMLGVRDAVADPEAALEAALAYVPEAGGENRAVSLDVLRASVPLWTGREAEVNGFGYTAPAAWAATRSFLRRAGSLGDPDVDVGEAYTNEFVLREG